MRIYLDDNLTDRRVVRELRQSEHDVVLPGAVGHSGVSDAKHLAYAMRHSYVFLTQNYQDFLDLHDLRGAGVLFDWPHASGEEIYPHVKGVTGAPLLPEHRRRPEAEPTRVQTLAVGESYIFPARR